MPKLKLSIILFFISCIVEDKNIEKLKEIKANGTTIVIVSHSMGQIEQICDRAIWLEDGLIKEEGIPKFVGEHYLATMENQRLEKKEEEYQKIFKEKKLEEISEFESKLNDDEEEAEIKIEKKKKILLPAFCNSRAVRSGNRIVEFTEVQMLNSKGKETMVFSTGEQMLIKMQYVCHQIGTSCNFTIGITRDDGVYCYGSSVLLDSKEVIIAKEIGEATITIEYNRLLPGKYFLDIGAQAEDYLPYDTICSVKEFQVTVPVINEFGILSIEHKWKVDGNAIKQKNS